ncbi:hypothetical protein ESCO_000643 [Escovopsis weberi]|uniref:Uncharacterized protein n=1 Tax=Escovopsis weberi TaxID=150374 RepID=A0A0M8MUA3_ESCWE|nr:hypothetical protein ESCO_000643 [Escovopsis weberi]
MDLDPPHPNETGGVEATPISQLHPNISDPASRVVAGVITVTWPYSKVNRSIAFILAEHDVRLRRDRGRLRVEFHGAAGRALDSFGIGAGDRVRISLEGAQWERNQVASKHPVPPLEWQLKFKDLLHMQIRRDESDATEAIDVDVSAAPGPPGSEPDYDLSVLFEPQPQADNFSVPEIPRFTSPIKQTAPAFDSGDPQAEQLSDSDSDSEAAHEAVNEPEPMETEPPVESTPRPPMVDQGCQTQELDYSPRMGRSRTIGLLPRSKTITS